MLPGLTQVQWRALVHLSRNEGLNQVALAEILDVQRIMLARLIDRMERHGWVERRSHPSVRRAVRLLLTPKTVPLELSQRAKETLDEAMLGLSKAAREATIDMVLRIKWQHARCRRGVARSRAGNGATAMQERAPEGKSARSEKFKSPASATAGSQPAPSSARCRKPLLMRGPLLVAAVALYVIATGGHYISTDNAFVKADKVTLSAQIGDRLVFLDEHFDDRAGRAKSSSEAAVG